MSEEKNDAYSGKPVKCPCCLSEHDSFRLCRAGKNKKYTQYRCCRCGFQFTWPCPTTEEIDRFYSSEEYYSQTGESPESDPGNYTDYDEEIKYTLDFFRGWLKSFALPEKSTMLDVGCALGRFMELARKEFGLECTGVELSDYARDYVKGYYNGSFPVCKTVDDLPIPKKPFDLILLFDVIEHVNDPWELLLGLFRRGCVGENTRILITTPNCVHKDALKDPGAWKYRYPPAHLSFCAPETFQKIGEALLFKKIDISGHSFLVDEGSLPIADMLQETFRDYEGLVCCFAGSILGKISPESFPASLDELKKNGEYLALLAEFVLGKQNQPFNPLFRSWLADFCQEMTAQNDRLNKMYPRLEADWKEKIAQIEKLNGMYARLETDWKEKIAQIEKLNGMYAQLETDWKDKTDQNRNLSEMYGRLETDWKDKAAQIEKMSAGYKNLTERYAVLEKEHNSILAANSALIAEIATVNRNSYSMWLRLMDIVSHNEQMAAKNTQLEIRLNELSGYKDQLENQVRELAGCKEQLENQVRELAGARAELSAYKDHLENQVREIDGARARLEGQLHELGEYKDHLENQVRELAGYKDHLESQVREFSARLNEVYHSRSFRIGRMITWPFRKCKDAAVSVFGKSRSSSEKQAGRPYDVVSSLGVNCEVSFNLNRVFGFVDSYPLIWAYVHSLGHLPELIENPMILASDRKMEHNYEHNMVRFPEIDVSFHCKGLPGDLLGSDGKVDEKKAQAERDELKSRLAYLAGKWKALLDDPSRTVLFVLTPWEDRSTTKEILAVHKALRKYPGADLLAVLTGKEKNVSASKLRSKGIFVRYITRHPPHDKITDLQSNDLEGWERICREFPPLNKKTSNKVFKYEK